jgi:hypothetical protein
MRYSYFSNNIYTSKTTTDNGVWMDSRDWDRVSICVDGITTGTVAIVGSNAPAKPAATVHGEAVHAALTADGFAYVTDKMPRWFKVYITVATTISLNVDIFVRRAP